MMNEYITPNYETISVKQKRHLMELVNSSILNGFSERDYLDMIEVFQRVVERLVDLDERRKDDSEVH